MGNKIYTAGFDIFHPQAGQHMQNIQHLCIQHGFDPAFQTEAPVGSAPAADDILKMNLERIDACDIVAANVNPFRGHEMDSGTAFEIGYAHAKGKIIYAYMDDTRTMVEKMGSQTDAAGYRVEDFGLPLNLMIACTSKLVKGDLQDCLQAICNDAPFTE
ncbi:MAG: nucleoside 2-deoxyribosyltransferase [Oscillospiraceae bacterium]